MPPLPGKLDLESCLTPEAKNWTDLSYRIQLSVWDGSGAKIECPGPSSIKSKKHMSEEQNSESKSGGHSMGVFGSKRVRRSARSERSEPRERSEACSERSDEVRDCKLHITQTEART